MQPSLPPPTDRLESWGEIANYLGSTMTTVRRWEKDLGLPIRRQQNVKRGSVIAYRHELDAWRAARITSLPEAPKPDPRSPRTRWWIAGLAAAAALLLGAVWARRDPLTNFDVEHLMLTAYPGAEGHVSFAPGGQHFAYTGGDAAAGFGVFVKQVGVEPARLIYSDPAKRVCCLAWSPNGATIAISYLQGSVKYRVGLIDSSGKWLRELGVGGPGISWRRDSQALLYTGAESPGAPFAVFEHHLESGQKRQISFPPAGSWGDILGVPSPSGSQLGLTRYSSVGKGDIYVTPYGGKEAKRLTHLENWVIGLDWFPSGDQIVFGGTAGLRGGLFVVNSANPGDPRLISGTQGVNRVPSVIRLGDGTIRIGYEQENWNMDLTLWDPATGGTRLVAPSNRGEETPDMSDAGDLVFMSQRSGAPNLWVCDKACQHPKQITNFREVSIEMTPRWSPDGRRIAFITREDRAQSLRIIGAGGEDSVVRAGGFDVGDPSWSADGRFVYFRSNRSGQQEIWKTPADGSAEARQVTRSGGAEAFESADGRWLYLTHGPELTPVMRLPVDGGSESPVTEVGLVRRGYWRAAGTSIYFWKDDGCSLVRFDTLTGRTAEVLKTAKNTRAFSFSANAAGLVVWSHQGGYFGDLYAVDLRPSPFWRLW